MKKKILFIAFVTLFFLENSALQAQNYTKLSPSTSLKMHQWKDKLSTKALTLDSTNLVIEYMPAFVQVNSEEGWEALKVAGCRIRTKAKTIATVDIPYNKVEEVANLATIKYVDCAKQMKITNVPLDSAALFSNALPAYAGTNLSMPYTGKGVIVGIVDTGFDYTHPTFYNSTGTKYRVKYVWDQHKTGTFGEYETEAKILAAKYDLTTELHGTHVAGIAVGSGYTTKYRGVAFESDPYIVATTMASDAIIDGVAKIFASAILLDQPCVINLSLGSFETPRDGTNSFDLMMNELTGPGKIVVAAAGNSQLDSIFVEKEFLKKDTLYTFNKPMSSSDKESYLGFCGTQVGAAFSISASVYNRATGKLLTSTPFISSTSTTSSSSYTLKSGINSYLIQFSPAFYQHTGKYGMEIYLKYPTQDVSSSEAVLLRVVSSSGKVRGWSLNENSTFSDLHLGLPYMNGSTQYLIGSPADADSVIAVGAYAARLSVHDIYGDSYSFAKYAKGRGEIASFSSNGPTMDERIKPDVSAPGLLLYSAYSSYYETKDYEPKVQQTSFNGKTYDWVAMSGTSMSSPYVTGSIALWLQANPTLSPSQIKALLSRTAVQDKVMGYPNNTWGYGKIDIYKGLLDILGLPTDSKEITIEDAVTIYTDGVAGSFHIRWVEAPAAFTVCVVDMGGRIIYKRDVTNQADIETIVCLGSVPNGIYTVQIKTAANTVVRKVKL